MVIFLGLSMVAHTAADPDDLLQSARTWDATSPSSTVTLVGGLHGLVCGLLGISGGVIATPAQQLLLRVPARHAVANTIFVSACSTGIGATVSVAVGALGGTFHIADVLFATLCVGGGAAVGARIGARMTGLLPVFLLKLLFVMASLAAGVAILFKA
jgi:uncharacterized membrane protein YfcA